MYKLFNTDHYTTIYANTQCVQVKQSLNENFPDSLSPVFKSDINNLNDVDECCSNNQETIKLKFKNLFEFKKANVSRCFQFLYKKRHFSNWNL